MANLQHYPKHFSETTFLPTVSRNLSLLQGVKHHFQYQQKQKTRSTTINKNIAFHLDDSNLLNFEIETFVNSMGNFWIWLQVGCK